MTLTCLIVTLPGVWPGGQVASPASRRAQLVFLLLHSVGKYADDSEPEDEVFFARSEIRYVGAPNRGRVRLAKGGRPAAPFRGPSSFRVPACTALYRTTAYGVSPSCSNVVHRHPPNHDQVSFCWWCKGGTSTSFAAHSVMGGRMQSLMGPALLEHGIRCR